ncbi:MAG: hypothetical protein LUO79_06700 [Methanomassiliicoccales archaeon]|nr:hypothetical protein [Methanomassiliicoccales archaeon]
MNLKNDTYVVMIGNKKGTVVEHYYRDEEGWVKITSRGREMRATAEQVLNHVLPAVAGLKPNVVIQVGHYEDPRDRPI